MTTAHMSLVTAASPFAELLSKIFRVTTTDQSAQLAREAQAHATAGDLTLAAEALDRAAEAERAADTNVGKRAAQQLQQAAQSLREQNPIRLGQLIAYQDVFGRLSPQQQSVFASIGETQSGVPRIAFTRANVKGFINDFAEGALNPSLNLNFAEDRHLLARWKAAPSDHRIFIAGSGKDMAKIEQLQSRLGNDGYVVFFYKFCTVALRRFCSSRAVGAFFATAGVALLADTEAAADSSYVRYEVAAAQLVTQGQQLFIMITPGDVLRSLTAPTVSAVAVALNSNTQ